MPLEVTDLTITDSDRSIFDLNVCHQVRLQHTSLATREKHLPHLFLIVFVQLIKLMADAEGFG